MTRDRTLDLSPQELDEAGTSEAGLQPIVPAVARVLKPNRTQMELRAVDLDSQLS